MKKGVQTLKLDFSVKLGLDPDKNYYSFPKKLLLPHSRGHNVGFKFLKVLRLKFVDVADDVLEYFISKCPVLERLTVVGATSLANLRVVGPVVALKYLEVRYCAELRRIEISDANLASFSCIGFSMNLLLSNVPLLIDVSVYLHAWLPSASIAVSFSQLSCCLPQLERLKLDISGAVYDRELVLPQLANLKHLTLRLVALDPEALRHLASFLKACPFLERVVLELAFDVPVNEGKLKKAAKWLHHHLKVVQVVGYRAAAVELVMYLLRSAATLEKIVIDPVLRWLYPIELYPDERDRQDDRVNKEREARKHAMKHLKHKVPSTIEFVCL